VPPFDAETYVRREVEGARATIAIALYGLVLGIVGTILGFYINNNVAPLGVFFLGLTAMKGIMYSAAAVDTDNWDRKTWLANTGLLFFTWLSAWVLFSNKPFMN
jgi:uncharacterized membrane protein HdeD (DUF308 family)